MSNNIISPKKFVDRVGDVPVVHFLTLHKTPPQCFATRVDEDGVPTAVQYIEYLSDTKQFKVVVFDGDTLIYNATEFGADLNNIPPEVFNVVETLTLLQHNVNLNKIE